MVMVGQRPVSACHMARCHPRRLRRQFVVRDARVASWPPLSTKGGSQRRRRRRKKRSIAPVAGASPGTLSIDPDAPRPRLRAFGYSVDAFEEHATCSLSDIDRLKAKYPVVWLDVVGLGDEPLLRAI